MMLAEERRVIFMMEGEIPRVKHLADVPEYHHVHSFQKTKFPGDGFWYCQAQVKPWCIYYCFSGHYFDSLDEALKYAAKRKFISYDMVQRIKTNLQERGIFDE